MKKQLLCGAAAGAITAALAGPGFTADLPVKAAPKVAAAPIAYSWSGWYIGGHVGWGKSRFRGIWFGDSGTVDLGRHSLDGFLGGLQLGYDQHLNNNIVVGLVGDVSFMNLKSDVLHGTTAGVDDLYGKLKLLASLRANLGLLLTERTLLFVSGGLGYANGKFHFDDTGSPKSADLSKWGGVVGGGIRYAFTDNLIGGVEGLYFMFKDSERFTGSSDNAFAEMKNATVVRVTLDWKWK